MTAAPIAIAPGNVSHVRHRAFMGARTTLWRRYRRRWTWSAIRAACEAISWSGSSLAELIS